MEFGSLRRKNRISQPSRNRKTFSTSNLSCISCNSASIGRKSLTVTLPKDFGCELNLDSRIVHVRKGSAAHNTGILQIGDYLRLVEEEQSPNNEDLVKLQVTFGILQVDSRPSCPLVIEIGNRSCTSLGIALADFPGSQIRITSIQPGSLADRCGFLRPGDCLTSVHIGSNETVPCSPYYTSYQIAQILRQLTSQSTSVKLTIVPCCDDSSQVPTLNGWSSSTEDDGHSGGSDSTLTLTDRIMDNNCPSNSNSYSNSFDNHGGSLNIIRSNNNTGGGGGIGYSKGESISITSFRNPSTATAISKASSHRIDEEDETSPEESECVLSLCLWKDRLYEDWGFSLVDDRHSSSSFSEGEDEEDTGAENVNNETRLMTGGMKSTTGAANKVRQGAIVFQIRPGGPAFVAGLRSGDRILQINDRNVSQLESTMLVPILASLEDALNLVVSRSSSNQIIHN